jgi:type II secretory pathway component PulJ
MSDLPMVPTESKYDGRQADPFSTGPGSVVPECNGSVDGFSLIEVLVILLLLALMSVMSLTFLNQLGGFHVRNVDSPYQDEADSAVRHIERTLKQALPLPLEAGGEQNRIFFAGTPHVVTFVTQSRMGSNEAAVRTTRIGLTAEQSGGALVQSVIIRRPERRRRTGNSEDFEILRGVSELEFGYLLFDRTGSPVWEPVWGKESLLPMAVSVDLAIDRHGKRYTASGLVQLPASRSVEYYFNCPDRGYDFRLDDIAEQSSCRARLARSGEVSDFCSCESQAR